MNRRDLLHGIAFVSAGTALAYVPDDGVALFATEHPGTTDRGPYDTDDSYYDEILDELLGEEWS